MPFYITLHYLLHLANFTNCFIVFVSYFEHAYVYWETVSRSICCKYLPHVEIELGGDNYIAFDPKSYHYVLRSKSKFFISLMIFEYSVIYFVYKTYTLPKAVARRFSVKKAFLKISQTSQENTSVGVSFLMKFQS